MEQERPIWFQRDEESGPAFAAFCAYRDMGTSRTFDGAFRNLREKSGKPPVGTASKGWWEWAARFEWQARCRAFDRARELEAEEVARRRHRERLEKAQDDIDTLAELSVRVAKKTLESAERAADIEPTSDAAPAATARIRAAMTAATTATTLRADAAGIGEYIERTEAQRAQQEDEGDE